MVEKRYVAKKRIPEYCPFGSVMSLKVESENDAPACFGRVVGYQYEGSDEVVSTIEGDNLKAKGERIIDRLMYDGYLVNIRLSRRLTISAPSTLHSMESCTRQRVRRSTRELLRTEFRHRQQDSSSVPLNF